jgi:signal transduction histidine kinase
VLVRATRNLKLHGVLYGIASLIVTVIAFAVGWSILSRYLTGLQLLGASAGIAALCAGGCGFVAARHIQRRLDRLHLGIIQLHKGNLAFRLRRGGADPFDEVYADFNRMAASLEERMKYVQERAALEMEQEEIAERAVAEERRRLARDLHDTVSQQLFAMHMHASSLPMILERNPAQAEPIMKQLIDMSHLAQKHIRGLIAQLRPLELEGRSLTQALEMWFPDYCNHNGLKGDLDIRLQGDLPDALEHQVFLIIQEAVANVVKHASARHVHISVQETEHQYIVAIVDDGVGFAQETSRKHSYGLTTMSERARKMGGELEITSRAGAGTRIRVNIPKFIQTAEGTVEDESDQNHDR